QGPVRGVGLHARQLAPALVVEVLHQGRVRREALGRRHRLDAMPLPQAVRGAEGRHAALGRDAGAGQDDKVHAGLLWARLSCSQSIMARTLGGTWRGWGWTAQTPSSGGRASSSRETRAPLATASAT